MKTYNVMYGIGKSKYVVNFYDGIKKHKDGSKFYDIDIFKNKKSLNAFLKILKQKGFKDE